MGRAPCCDKANVKKGPWSPDEDATLKSYIDQHGTGGNWIALPQKIGLKRCGKSCRLRWLNYLRPNIKHGGFSEEEDHVICSLYISIGSRWSIIAAQLPGRTDNDIKNYWNTRLKKKLLGKQQRKDQNQHRRSAGILTQDHIIRNKPATSMLVTTTTTTTHDHNYTNQTTHCWPELPVMAPMLPHLQYQSRLNDHSSIRKLLIKLGGKFSDDQIKFHHDAMMNNTNIGDLFADNQYNNNTTTTIVGHDSSFSMLQGQNSNFPVDFEDIMVNNQQRLEGLDGLEFPCSDHRVDGSGIFGWGNEMMSSLFSPSVALASSSENAHFQDL